MTAAIAVILGAITIYALIRFARWAFKVWASGGMNNL